MTGIQVKKFSPGVSKAGRKGTKFNIGVSTGMLFKVSFSMPSTVIRSIDYNAAKAVLTITFVSGAIYEYYNVEQELYDNFRSFREKGVFYNENIKGRYRFARIG